MIGIGGRLLLAVSFLPWRPGARAAQFAAAATVDLPAKIEIRAKRSESFDPREALRKTFGSLEFRGGLELSSPHKQFGGLSAIRLAVNGANFLAVTDRGFINVKCKRIRLIAR